MGRVWLQRSLNLAASVAACLQNVRGWGNKSLGKNRRIGGGRFRGRGRAPYAGYYAGWVNEDQQMKAIRLPAGGVLGVVQREAARDSSVFQDVGLIILFPYDARKPLSASISPGWRLRRRLMCGWGFTWNMLEVMDLSRRAPCSFPSPLHGYL